jgi:flagellar biosynthetic protein FliR
VLPPGTLVTLGLVLVRSSAMVLAAPLLGNGSSFSGYKVGLIGALSLLSFTTLEVPLEASVGPIEFGAMALRETLIGVALASVLQAVLLAVRVAGEMVGHEMAFNMSSIADPITGVRTPLITQIYEGMFFLGLLAVDGHHLLIRALSDSFDRAPIGDIAVSLGMVEVALRLFGDMFAAGVTFAAPVLVLLVLVSLLIGLLARSVPQLNVLEIGFTLRIVVALLAMFGFAPLLAPAMEGLYDALASGLGGMLDALEA